MSKKKTGYFDSIPEKLNLDPEPEIENINKSDTIDLQSNVAITKSVHSVRNQFLLILIKI